MSLNSSSGEPSLFSSPSFMGTSGTLGGGTGGMFSPGKIYSYSIPSTPTPTTGYAHKRKSRRSDVFQVNAAAGKGYMSRPWWSNASSRSDRLPRNSFSQKLAFRLRVRSSHVEVNARQYKSKTLCNPLRRKIVP